MSYLATHFERKQKIDRIANHIYSELTERFCDDLGLDLGDDDVLDRVDNSEVFDLCHDAARALVELTAPVRSNKEEGQ